MAYVVGLLTVDEKVNLELRGWDVEPGPVDLLETDPHHGGEIHIWEGNDEFLCRVGPNDDTVFLWCMVWVDSSMFEVMTGPDWEGPVEEEPKSGRQQRQ